MIQSFPIRNHASSRLGEGEATLSGEAAATRRGTIAESARLNPISSPPALLTNSLRDRFVWGAMTYALLFVESTARRTAAKIPTWLPQRHTSLSNASLISPSVGF